MNRPAPPHAAAAAAALQELIGIMERLRGPGGCPWDREQDARSIKPYLIEEAYEVLEALESGATAQLCEELGDLLFQIIFHAELAREAGAFTIAEVVRSACDKMVRRHPHVFGDAEVRDAEEVLVRWEEHKRRERQAVGNANASSLDGAPRNLPSLLRAQRLQEKAARGGFDWSTRAGVQAKVEEEWRELGELVEPQDGDPNGSPQAIEDEFGDLLFSMVNLGRWLGLNAEEALQGATRRFETRFRHLEGRLAAAGRRLEEAPMSELEALWEEAKRLEHAASTDTQEGAEGRHGAGG